MTRTSNNKRVRLVASASEISYRQGFHATSLADIAKRARVPLGNVYYYFKTKDEIGGAIIDERLAHFRSMCEQWEGLASTSERLKAFVRLTIESRKDLAQSGCPNGTLCSELHKDAGPLADRATDLLSEPLHWVETQFRAIGKGKQSRALAVHLLAALQGIAVLAHAFADPDIVTIEARHLCDWIDEL